MMFEFDIRLGKFICGNDDYCFRQVIDDFKNAEYINIVTYNISPKKDYLMSKLGDVQTNAKIRIITNIPNRFEEYFEHHYDVYRKNAKKNIEIYLDKLDPRKFEEKASVFFKFDNHAKIVMTNNIMYWGSSNYSDDSKKSIECGTISLDENLINYVNSEVISCLVNGSEEYFGDEKNRMRIRLNSTISKIYFLREELHQQNYFFYDHYPFKDEKPIFNKHNNLTDIKTLEEIDYLMNVFLELLGEASDMLEINRSDEVIFEGIISDISIINDKYSSLMYSKEIYEMAKYDVGEESNDIIQNEFAMEAFDENLNYYTELAMDKAMERNEELAQECEESMARLFILVADFLNKATRIISIFVENLTPNENIDNTGD